MNSLNQVLRLTWAIVSKTPDEKTRLQALTLITETNKYKIDLATNGTIVTDAIKCVQSKMDHLDSNNNNKVVEQEPTVERNIAKTNNSVF